MRTNIGRLNRHLFTLYLVTASDFVSVLIPQTMFASFSILSGKFRHGRTSMPISVLSARLPAVVFWIWLQLLVLDLANQRLPDSVAEDRLNKPWRPIPSGRLTCSGAKDLLIFSIAFTFVASVLLLGGVYETLVLFALNWLYNDLGLANSHWFLRNLLNSLGITAIGAGAMAVGQQGLDAPLDWDAAHWWLFLCAGVLMTTIQAQDLYDQAGDAARHRSTAPLVLGDTAARWSVAIPVVAWSVAMPALVGLQIPEHYIGYAVPACTGVTLAARVLTRRSVPDDKATFRLWAVWCVLLYALPMAI
ncbi:UbiA prenyltransferase [Apiospora sp. TS-2023a]